MRLKQQHVRFLLGFTPPLVKKLAGVGQNIKPPVKTCGPANPRNPRCKAYKGRSFGFPSVDNSGNKKYVKGHSKKKQDIFLRFMYNIWTGQETQFGTQRELNLEHQDWTAFGSH